MAQKRLKQATIEGCRPSQELQKKQKNKKHLFNKDQKPMTTFNYQEFLNGPASNLSEDFKTSAGRMIPRLFPKNDTPQGIKTVILSPNFKEKTILAPSLGS